MSKAKAKDVTFFEFYNDRRKPTIGERIMKPFVDFIIGTFAIILKLFFKLIKAYYYGASHFDFKYVYWGFCIFLLYNVIISIAS